MKFIVIGRMNCSDGISLWVERSTLSQKEDI